MQSTFYQKQLLMLIWEGVSSQDGVGHHSQTPSLNKLKCARGLISYDDEYWVLVAPVIDSMPALGL